MSGGAWLSDVLDVLLPAGCVSCGAWIPGGRDLVCPRCRSRLREAPWPRCGRCHHPSGTGRGEVVSCLECAEWADELSAARFAYVLEGPVTHLVHALKYEGWRELAPHLAGPMARLLAEPGFPGGRVPLVVPVPTTARRAAARGYNQARLLAEAVARARGLTLLDALARGAAGRSQTALAPAARRANVLGAFVPASACAGRLTGRHVVLVDDVLTTGATASEAARTLVRAGARTVTLLAFARALPRVRRQAA